MNKIDILQKYKYQANYYKVKEEQLIEPDIEIILGEKSNELEENGVALLNLEDGEILKNLLTRYKQLEEENKKLEDKLSKIIKYSNWEIENYTETILDYIDDDKIGNADFIGELKENREHWKDINKICNGEEDLYNNYYVE